MSAIAARKNSLSNTVLKAVIIYDDFDSATRATALLERVAARADAGMKWDIKPWRFDVLKQPALAALTVAVAANADLVVLALEQKHLMPAELLDWLKNWAERRRIADAALLALPSGETGVSARWNEVRAIAEKHDLVYLDRHDTEGGRNAALFGKRWQKRLVVHGPARTVPGQLPQPSRWGINE